MSKVTKLIVSIILVVASAYVNLWCCTKAWELIAVPMGAQPIDFMKALGISWLSLLFVHTGARQADQEAWKTATNSLVHSGFIMALIYLFFGK